MLENLMLPDFYIYSKALAIKTVKCWHKIRQKDQCTRTGSLKIDPHLCGHLIFNKGAYAMQWEKDESSQ